MKRLSLLTAIGLSLSLSPLALTAAAADPSASANRRPVHKALSWFHVEANAHAETGPGAFLEFTAAAP